MSKRGVAGWSISARQAYPPSPLVVCRLFARGLNGVDWHCTQKMMLIENPCLDIFDPPPAAQNKQMELASQRHLLHACSVQLLTTTKTKTCANEQVLPRDAKMGTTVEHVKQLRDDITTTTAQSFRETFRESDKVSEDRSARLEARMSSLEMHLAKISALLENGSNTYGGGRGGVGGNGNGSGATARTAASASNGSATMASATIASATIASNHRSTNSQLMGSHQSGE